MGHAKILADFHVRDPEEWKRRIQKDGLDTRSLRKLLREDRGGRLRGRPKTYFKREKSGIRLYACKVSFNAPRAERERVARALEEVVGLLRKGAQDSSA